MPPKQICSDLTVPAPPAQADYLKAVCKGVRNAFHTEGSHGDLPSSQASSCPVMCMKGRENEMEIKCTDPISFRTGTFHSSVSVCSFGGLWVPRIFLPASRLCSGIHFPHHRPPRRKPGTHKVLLILINSGSLLRGSGDGSFSEL